MSLQAKLYDTDQTKHYITLFHHYGHGIDNGLSLEEHLRRVLLEAEGMIILVISRDDKPVGAVTMVPGPVEDSHFPGQGIMCAHVAGEFGFDGMRLVHRTLRELCKANDAQWYSMSHRVSRYEYRNRYFMIGDCHERLQEYSQTS